MSVNRIGERLYKRLTLPIDTGDGTYVSGCVHHLGGGRIEIMFFKYRNGKGVVELPNPSRELLDDLKTNWKDLKEYVAKRKRKLENWEDEAKNRPLVKVLPNRKRTHPVNAALIV